MDFQTILQSPETWLVLKHIHAVAVQEGKSEIIFVLASETLEMLNQINTLKQLDADRVITIDYVGAHRRLNEWPIRLTLPYFDFYYAAYAKVYDPQPSPTAKMLGNKKSPVIFIKKPHYANGTIRHGGEWYGVAKAGSKGDKVMDYLWDLKSVRDGDVKVDNEPEGYSSLLDLKDASDSQSTDGVIKLLNRLEGQLAAACLPITIKKQGYGVHEYKLLIQLNHPGHNFDQS